jgi:hypothetical protein
MATRHAFGGDLTSWTFTVGAANAATLASAAIRFYNAQVGGTEYTDFTSDAAGTTPLSGITSSDGSGGQALGTIPTFYGPPDVWFMYASAGGGQRMFMPSVDLAAALQAAVAALTGTQSDLTAHVGAHNPHATHVGELADVDTTTTPPTDGQALVYHQATGLWLPGSVASGGGGGSYVSTAGGSTILIPEGDFTTMALKILLPSGDRTGAGAPNTISVQWNAGTAGSPNWQETFRLNEFGELRLQPSAINRVAFRLKQFNGSQSANLMEFTDFSNNVLAFVTASGAGRFPNLGMVFPFSLTGNVATTVGVHRLYNDTGVTQTIRAVRASVGTAPTGASLIVDVNKNGTTVFTTQANRPTIPAGTNTSGRVTSINTTSVEDGAYLTIDVDQVGSTTPGANLTVQVLTY